MQYMRQNSRGAGQAAFSTCLKAFAAMGLLVLGAPIGAAGGLAAPSGAPDHPVQTDSPAANRLSHDVHSAGENHPAKTGKPVLNAHVKSAPDGHLITKLADHAVHTSAARQTARPFGMHTLIERLKKTDALGVFTKLAIRSDALDLMDMVKVYNKHRANFSLKELRARFDGLVLKVLALLDDDPKLSRDIYLARERIWKSLLEVNA